LAVARLRLLSPQALLARLEHRLPLLTGGARDLPARQQTLANTIAWSYDLLEAHEQVLFRRLGVFKGGCTLEAAEAVCGEQDTQESRLLHRVESLVAQSLLLQQDQPDGEVRFTMLETLREFAWEQLQRQGEVDTVQQRHLDYYLPWTVEACRQLYMADQLMWLAWLDREEDNLRAALDRCMQRSQHGDSQATEQGLQFAGVLGEWYWSLHARYSEGLSWLERLLSLPDAAARTPGRAQALLGVGLLSIVSGWFPRGGNTPTWAIYEEALAIGHELGDKAKCAMAHMGLTCSLPDPRARRLRCEDGLHLYREMRDTRGIAFALCLLGETLADAGDVATAQTLLEESLAVNAGVHDRWISHQATRVLALIAAARGDALTARILLEEALYHVHELGYQLGIGENYASLGHLSLQARDQIRARDFYCRALPIFLDSGAISGSAQALMGLASLALDEELPIQAVRLAGFVARITGEPTWAGALHWADVPGPAQIWENAAQVLGKDRLIRAWAEGQALTLEQAIAYALTGCAYGSES
jgi:tetratricopeptide (TPR) repeat protein